MSRETLEGPSLRRWIGRVLRDRWRIDARISRGGVGTVYAATHKNNGSRAAIKVLHPEFARDADTRSRFLQEGYAANQVNHPGVVRILDDDTSEDGHPYLVMELLEGELLEARRIRKGGKLALVDVYEVGEQLLDVLAAAHEKEIVHRDIKPDNLFITHEGRLKVLDFGFAQMRSSFRSEQTATGFLLGTPGFMSPEQAIGDRPQVDAQTDIWAVGATLFTLISGEPVHAGESAAEMLVAAANVTPRSLATVAHGLSPRLVKVVDRALAFDKRDRWPNARSMQLALRGVSGKQAAGQVSRRSIPDDLPSYEDDVEELDESTQIEDDIEELDASELEDAKGSWGSAEGAPADAQAVARLGSAITLPVPAPAAGSRHPADDEGPTIAASSPGAGMVDAQSDGGTLIMETPVHSQQAPPQHAPPPRYGQAQGEPLQPQPTVPPRPPQQLFVPTDPRGMNPQDLRHLVSPGAVEMPYAASSATQTQPMRAQRASRVLVFIGVAVCTMLVVIVAGLVILSVSD